jgi:hypothetical protein
MRTKAYLCEGVVARTRHTRGIKPNHAAKGRTPWSGHAVVFAFHIVHEIADVKVGLGRVERRLDRHEELLGEVLREVRALKPK